MVTPRTSDRWFAAARVGAVTAGVLALVRLLTGGTGAVFEQPFTLLLAFALGTLAGYAILSLRAR